MLKPLLKKVCGLPAHYLCGLMEQLMKGSKSGVEYTWRRHLWSHCINHNLALVWIYEVHLGCWSVIESDLEMAYIPKSTAAFAKVCKTTRQLDIEAGKNLSGVEVQKACPIRWLSKGKAVTSVSQHLVPLQSRLSGSLKIKMQVQLVFLMYINNTKFVGRLHYWCLRKSCLTCIPCP